MPIKKPKTGDFVNYTSIPPEKKKIIIQPGEVIEADGLIVTLACPSVKKMKFKAVAVVPGKKTDHDTWHWPK